MIFVPTMFAGAWLIQPEYHADERGSFARGWCYNEFAAHGIEARFVQGNISINHTRGTVRGMHFQLGAHVEAKLVRCTRGSILDVIVDLRPESPTRCRWQGFELTADNHHAVFVPEGFAHGFQTLTDDTEVNYQVSSAYHGASACGVRWDDPAIRVEWPLPVSVILERDKTWPELT